MFWVISTATRRLEVPADIDMHLEKLKWTSRKSGRRCLLNRYAGGPLVGRGVLRRVKAKAGKSYVLRFQVER